MSARVRYAFFLIGELVGFSLYHCTLGALLIGAAKGIIAAIRWLFGLIYRVFVAPVLRLLEKIRPPAHDPGRVH